VKKVYRGLLELGSNGEEDELLRIAGSEEVLAELVMEDIEEFGDFLTVRYFTAEKELTEDELIEALVKKVSGVGDALYNVAYSEITGYLWTDEKLNVGGHDLLGELKSHVGKFCHLEIEFYASDKRKVTE